MEACLLTGLSLHFGQFLVATFREQQRLFDDPVSELRIGIFTDSVVTVHEHACLSEVLDLLERHGASYSPCLLQASFLSYQFVLCILFLIFSGKIGDTPESQSRQKNFAPI